METAIVFLIDTYRLIRVGGRTDTHRRRGEKEKETEREGERDRDRGRKRERRDDGWRDGRVDRQTD